MFARSLFTALSVVLLASGLFAAAPAPPDVDEAFLSKHGLPTDSAGLIRFLRERSEPAPDPRRIGELVKQLGDERFEKREEASRLLARMGQPAVRELRKRLDDGDLEIQRRAKSCLEQIDKQPPPDSVWHAVRLLGRRGGKGATEALLAFLPSTRDEEVEEAVYYALARTAFRDGKPAVALKAALGDPAPARRAVAACLLGRSGPEGLRLAVRKRLTDADATVRLRAAQGLLAGGDASGLAALVGLLRDAPREVAWQAEELLRYVTGDDSPAEVVGRAAAQDRKRCQLAWQRWLREKAAKVELGAVQRSGRRPGLILVFEGAEPGNENPAQRKRIVNDDDRLPLIWLCGCEGQPRCDAMPFADFVASRLPLKSHRQLVGTSNERVLLVLSQLGMASLWGIPSAWTHRQNEPEGGNMVHLIVQLTYGSRLMDQDARCGPGLRRLVERDPAGRVVWESVCDYPFLGVLICPLVRFGFSRPADVADRESQPARLQQLRHRETLVRLLAARKLQSMSKSDTVVRAIAARLDVEEDSEVRVSLLEVIRPQADIAGPALPAVIRQLYRANERGEHHVVSFILFLYGPKAQDVVIKAYHDRTGKYAVSRQEALAWVLGLWVAAESPKLHDAIRDALHNEHPSVRFRICEALRQCGKAGRRYAKDLIRLLTDEDNVAGEAAQALGVLGDKSALPALLKVASGPFSSASIYSLCAVGEINSSDFETAKMFKSMLDKEKDGNKRLWIVYAMDTHRGAKGIKLLYPILHALSTDEQETKETRDAAKSGATAMRPIWEKARRMRDD